MHAHAWHIRRPEGRVPAEPGEGMSGRGGPPCFEVRPKRRLLTRVGHDAGQEVPQIPVPLHAEDDAGGYLVHQRILGGKIARLLAQNTATPGDPSQEKINRAPVEKRLAIRHGTDEHDFEQGAISQRTLRRWMGHPNGRHRPVVRHQ